jgi:hypothetical protein
MLRYLEPWEWAIYVIAGYVAVTALVRLMLHRRGMFVEELRAQMSRKKKAKKK